MAQPSEETSRPETSLHSSEESLRLPGTSSEEPLQYQGPPLHLPETSSRGRLTETHFYDGQLGTAKATLEVDLIRASQKTSEEKLAAFGLLRSLIPKETHHNFDIIVRDFIRSGRTKGANHDPTNDLHADDLLYLCSELAGDPVMIELLTTQLVDMSTGICPQGRTHRLLQVLWALQ